MNILYSEILLFCLRYENICRNEVDVHVPVMRIILKIKPYQPFNELYCNILLTAAHQLFYTLFVLSISAFCQLSELRSH